MKKILVVDNQPMVLELLRNLLAKEGHEVRTAEDGLSAIEVLRTYVPEIIFVDLVMPNISGEKLCRIIRKMDRLRGVYLVILSDIAAEEQINVTEFGANACIAKGSFSMLARHVATIMDLAEAPGAQEQQGILGIEEVYQREITKELLSSRRHFEVILNNMSEGIIEATPEGRVIFVNPQAAALLHAPEEELLARELLDLFAERFREPIRQVFQSVEIDPAPLDDHKYPLEISGRQVGLTFYPVRDQGHRTIIVMLRDVTEYKEAQASMQKALDELKQAQAVLVRQEKLASIGTLASGVAHEILNPLNIIGTIVQILQLEEGPRELQEQLTEIMIQIRRATKITDNLRMFSRQHEAEIGEVNISTLFDKTAALLEHDLNLDNILIERDYDPDLPVIEGDDDQLAQVFFNLLRNSRDALEGRDDKRIMIRTARQNGEVEIRFSDTGSGIPRAQLDKIFDPFFTTKDPGHGTGLGLSIVYSVVEAHGGCIEVHSQEGVGTEFILRLPVRRRRPVDEPVGKGEDLLMHTGEN